MDTISRKFENGVGFSSGWAELALKNPPPLVPSCLMAIWDAAGPTAMTCVCPIRRWLEQGNGLILTECLHDTLGDKRQSQHEGKRQEDIQH